MADLFWKEWEMDCFFQGSQAFFHSIQLHENPYFSELRNQDASGNQVILIASLPKDKQKSIDWMNHAGSVWFDFLFSLSANTTVLSTFAYPEHLFSVPTQFVKKDTPYVKFEPESIQTPLFSKESQLSPVKIKNPYLPAILFDAERIVPVIMTDESYVFGMYSVLSSLFYLLPTITQVEILLLPNQNLRSQVLVQAVTPLIKKMKGAFLVNCSPIPFMVVSNDAVSADAYSAILNGNAVSSLPFLGIASKHKLGVSDLLMIHNRSDRFSKPVNRKKTKWSSRSRITINDTACTSCMDCASCCPLQALTLDNENRIRWNSRKCNRCGLCLDICPEKAMNS